MEPAAAQPRRGDRLRDEIYEVVDAYVLMKVQERLGLSDEQLTRLMPLIRKQHQDRRKMRHRRYKALGEMRRLLASGSASEERVVGLLREVKTVESDEPEAAQRNQAAIDGLLTPLQQAKYRVLMVEVERRLRSLRRRAHERRGGRGRAPQPPAP
jgi:hypothetical protein